MRHIYFHEDDYRQIEILPVKNLKFCLEQAGKIEEFSENHRDGMGWNDVYIREENPKKILELNIAIDEIRQSLHGKLPEYDEVYTGYGSCTTPCTRTHAFGKDDGSTLFMEINESGKLTSLWCSEPTTDLYYLPNHERFLLADWGWDFICPLTDKAAMDAYLAERERVFAEFAEEREAQPITEGRKWWKFW